MVDTLRCYYCKNDISPTVAYTHAEQCAFLHCGDGHHHVCGHDAPRGRIPVAPEHL